MSQSGLHGIFGLYAARHLAAGVAPGEPSVNPDTPAAGAAESAAGAKAAGDAESAAAAEAAGRAAAAPDPGGAYAGAFGSTSRTAFGTVSGNFKWGLVLGNIIPDADFFLLAPTYLFDSRLALSMHRTWSHSVLVQGAVSLLLLWLWARSDPARRSFVKGLWLGMLMHCAADVLMWFTGIDLLWPLGRWGLPSRVDLWSWFAPPGWLSNLLGAFDYLAFALFFAYLARVAVERGVDLDMVPRVRLANRALYVLLAVFTVLSFALAGSPGLYNVLDYAFFIVVFLPVEIWVLLRMRETIARA